MAKNGMKLLDSDRHIVEPPKLWERYINSACKDRAPKDISLVKAREGEPKPLN